MSLEALIALRRDRMVPAAVWVLVGEPPKWFEDGPDSIIVRRKAREIDWRPVIGLHVDFFEIGQQGDHFLQVMAYAEAAKPKTCSLACCLGVAGLNKAHEDALWRAWRLLNERAH